MKRILKFNETMNIKTDIFKMPKISKDSDDDYDAHNNAYYDIIENVFNDIFGNCEIKKLDIANTIWVRDDDSVFNSSILKSETMIWDLGEYDVFDAGEDMFMFAQKIKIKSFPDDKIHYVSINYFEIDYSSDYSSVNSKEIMDFIKYVIDRVPEKINIDNYNKILKNYEFYSGLNNFGI